MKIQPIKPYTPPLKGKINTGALLLAGMFIGSCAGAYFLNKGKKK